MENILIIQLPYPRLTLKAPPPLYMRPNLSAGNLKTYLDYIGLLNKKYNVDIAPQDIFDKGGDSLLLNYIKKNKLNKVFFYTFPWNGARSGYLASKIKAVDNSIQVYSYGPEASTDVLGYYKDFDFMILGMPENAFAIGDLACNENKIIGYKKIDYGYVENSPYLKGFMDLEYGGDVFWLQTSIGCPYRCKYCYRWGGASCEVLQFPLLRIQKELEHAKAYGKREIKIIDHTLNYSSYYLDILKTIVRKIDKEKQFSFTGNLRAELIDKKTAKLLKEMNFTDVAVGLQSITPKVLEGVNRKNYMGRFLTGVNLLRDAGINVTTEIILGLPCETSGTFNETIDFLIENELNQNCEAYVFCLYPQTPFYKESGKMGITFQKSPPHLILETPEMNFQDLKNAIFSAVTNKIRVILEPFAPFNDPYPNFATCSNGRYPYNLNEGSKVFDLPLEKNPISKIVFDFNKKCINGTEIIEKLDYINNHLANTVVLWFKALDLEVYMDFILKVLDILSRQNPYNVWHLIFEGKINNPSFYGKIKGGIFYYPNTIDYQAVYYSKDAHCPEYLRVCNNIYSIFKPHFENNIDLINKFRGQSKIVWGIENIDDLEKGRDFFENGDILLIDFTRKNLKTDIVKLFEYLKTNIRNGLNVKFKNMVFQTLWNRNILQKVDIEGLDENICFIENGKFKGFDILKKERVLKDILNWNLL